MANKFPFVFDKPFASEGDFVLPKFEADPKVANWPQGFSGRFSEPPEDGGLFIEREAMNGIHNALSQNQAWQQSGQLPTFDPAYVAKSGGYPRGAVLWNIPPVWEKQTLSGTSIPASATSWCGVEHYYMVTTNSVFHPVALISVKDNNTDDFTSNQQFIGDSWAVLFPSNPIETMRTNSADAGGGGSYYLIADKLLRRTLPQEKFNAYIKMRLWTNKVSVHYSSSAIASFDQPTSIPPGTGSYHIGCAKIGGLFIESADYCRLLCYCSRAALSFKKLVGIGNKLTAYSPSTDGQLCTLFPSVFYNLSAPRAQLAYSGTGMSNGLNRITELEGFISAEYDVS